MKISKGVQKTFDAFVARGGLILYAKVKDEDTLAETIRNLNSSMKRKEIPSEKPQPIYSWSKPTDFEDCVHVGKCIEWEGAKWSPFIPWVTPDILDEETMILTHPTHYMDWKAKEAASAMPYLSHLKIVKKISKGVYLVTWKSPEENSAKTFKTTLLEAVSQRKRSYEQLQSSFEVYKVAKIKYEDDLQAEKKLCYWE